MYFIICLEWLFCYRLVQRSQFYRTYQAQFQLGLFCKMNQAQFWTPQAFVQEVSTNILTRVFLQKKYAPTPFNFILKCYSKTFILEIFLFERDITCIWYRRYHLVVIRIWRIRILITWSLKVSSIGYLIHG